MNEEDIENEDLSRHSEAEEDPEFVAEEDLEENVLPKLKKLRGELKACQADKQEYLTLAQRSRADYINLQQSVEKGREDVLKFAKADLLKELIGLAESFEAALSADRQGLGAESQTVADNWRKGVESIYAQLQGIFDQNGVSEINPGVGEEFSPVEHDAMMAVPTDDEAKDGTVAAVVQKGYRLHERILRPAKVHVANFNK